MRKSKIQLLALMLLPMAAFAQENKTISGTIKSDTDGLPLIGVEIYVEGTTIETMTDENGYYELSVPDNSIITINYDGYELQQIPVADIDFYDFILNQLKTEQKDLDEVVVVGYGTTKKSDLTGAVGVIDSEKLTERGLTNPLEAIQGNVAGVQVTTSTGRIGDGFDIVIRGNNSMNADSKPLFVIDGVPAADIDFLNPQDIARIDILKDASSTAIYGSRGSNGVVIVTTKNGATAKGKFTLSYDTYYGVKAAARLPKMMDGETWWKYHQSAYLATASKDPATGAVSAQTLYNAVIGTKNSELLRRVNANETYDWFGAVLKTGITQNNYINMSGRSENGIGYNIGLGAQKEKGNLENEALDKYNFNLGVDHKINDKFSTGANISFALTEIEDGSELAMQEAFRLNTFLNPYAYNSTELTALPGKLIDNNGKNIIDKTSTYNPLLEIKNTSDKRRRWTGIGNFFFEYKPVKWLSLKTTYSANFDILKRGQSWGALTSVGASLDGMASAAITNNENLNYTWDNQVNANFNINEIHQFNILGLQSIYYNRSEASYSSSRNIPFETGHHNIGSGAQETFNISSAFVKQTLESYALRVNYTLLDKYLITGSIRWDGSSLLSEKNRWDYFPSAAVAWRLNKEEFLKGNKTVSDLKIRASWGYTGNNIISPYSTQNLLTLQLYYDYGGNVANGWVPGRISNPFLAWEKTREYNIGVDFGFFNNRITGGIDLYDKLSDNLLMKQQLPYETGWDYINGNVGSVSNKGIEASLTARIIKTAKVSWETTFTFAKNVNKIKSIYGQDKVDDIGNNLFIGESINSYYNYVFDGVWQPDQAAEATRYGQTVGQARVKDINGDGKITTDDRVILGNSDPDWTGSIFTTLKVGQFDISASLITNQGVLAYSPFHENFTNVYDRGRSKLSMDWFIPGNNAGLAPQYSNTAPQPYNEGTYWKDNKVGYYRDASFVKIKNISLGYTFSKETLRTIGLFNSLRVYANVINPFVFTKYDGYDPEWATASLGIGRVSSVIYQMGLNVKF